MLPSRMTADRSENANPVPEITQWPEHADGLPLPQRKWAILTIALGIIMAMRKKLAALKHTTFILCSVCPPLQQLLKITGLDKMLLIKPTQREALKVVPA